VITIQAYLSDGATSCSVTQPSGFFVLFQILKPPNTQRSEATVEASINQSRRTAGHKI